MKNKKVVLSVLSAAVVSSMASSAFAAELKNGIYLGGNVDKFYSLSSFFSDANEEQAIAELEQIGGFSKTVFVVDGKAAFLNDYLKNDDAALQDPTPEMFADGPSYKEIDKDGNIVKVFEPVDPTPPPAEELEVESVSAINAKQIKVVFNKAVDENSAETLTNYEINNAPLTGNDDAELQDDNKTVILTLTQTGALANDTAYKVDVLNVEDTEGNELAEEATFNFVANDEVAPTIEEVTAEAGTAGTRTVTVKFSEPVDVAGQFSINGVNATPEATPTATDWTEDVEVTLTTGAGQTLQAGQTYTLVASGTQDVRTNVMDTQTVQFTVVGDTTAPTLQSIEATGEEELTLTFDKEISDPGTITVNRLGGTVGVDSATVGVNNDNTKVVVDLTLNDIGYTLTRNSVELFVSVEDAEDVNGNVIAPITNRAVTVTRDTTAPQFLGATVSEDGSAIDLQFSEEITEVVNQDETTVTVVDPDGVVQAAADYISGNNDFDGEVVADENGNNTIYRLNADDSNDNDVFTAGTYTFSIPAGAVRDNSSLQNRSGAINFTVTVEEASNTDRPVPVINTDTTANANGTLSIVVDFQTVVKGGNVAGSATNPTYYKLNNAPLPQGTVITLNANKDMATITLPAGTFNADRPGAGRLLISGVQNSAGLSMSAPVSLNINELDNTAPRIVSAEAIDDNTIVLTMSENVQAGAGTNIGVYEEDGTAVFTDAAFNSINIVGKTVTIQLTAAGTPLAAVDFDGAKVTLDADVVQDISTQNNSNEEISETSAADLAAAPELEDGFAQAVQNLAIADAGVDDGTAADITLTFDASNVAADVARNFKVYIVEGGTPNYAATDIADLEGDFDPVLTIDADDVDNYSTANGGFELPGTLATISSGEAIATQFDGVNTVDIYVVVEDNNGNKAMTVLADQTTTNVN